MPRGERHGSASPNMPTRTDPKEARHTEDNMDDGDNHDDAPQAPDHKLGHRTRSTSRHTTRQDLKKPIDERRDAIVAPKDNTRRLLRAISATTTSTETDRRADLQSDLNADPKADRQTEPLLITLDQLSQTLDVMHSVVGRLRHHIEEQAFAQDDALRSAMSADRVLH